MLSARLNGRREQKFSVVCRGIGKISSGGVCRRNGATAIPRSTSPGPQRTEGKGPSVDCQRCGYAVPTTRGPERPPAGRASLRDRRTFSCAHIVSWLVKIKPLLALTFLRQGGFKRARIAASGARNLCRCPNLENFLAE